MIALIVLVLIVVLVAVGTRQAVGRPGGVPARGHGVRRFFQYVLLLGLLAVAASGLSGLLGRLLGPSTLVAGDQADLALNVTFSLVGIPLYLGLALWSRRRLMADRGERWSRGWAFYLGAATLTALVVAMFGLYDLLAWAVGLEDFDGRSSARLLVWGGTFAAHWWVGGRITPADRLQVLRLLASLIGLGAAASGLVTVLAGALDVLLGLQGEAMVSSADTQIVRGALVLVVGAPVWLLAWLRSAARAERDPLWLSYVLLVGVGGGLVTAITAASALLYDLLVWLVGDPGADTAAQHFRDAPTATAAAVVGLLVWWYHHAVLETTGDDTRTEVRRVYEYLMAGVGVLAAAAGLTTVLVALVEALTGDADLLVGPSAVNTLLAAATLLVVGGPVWWVYWRRIQRAAQAVSGQEHASPTRRIYLLVLFGLGGVAAVIAVLTGVYLLLEDAFAGTFGAETIRSMRFAVGVLVTAGAISAYHWTIYRAGRERAPEEVRGPRFVLLVGASDPGVVREVARRTGGQVQGWRRTDQDGRAWSVEEVMSSIQDTGAPEVLVLSEATGLRTVPLDRG